MDIKALIRETKALVRLQLFLAEEVGLKEELSPAELKAMLAALKKPKSA